MNTWISGLPDDTLISKIDVVALATTYQKKSHHMEVCIRPFVVGRNNRLFAGHANGAHAGATFISLIETAWANGLELMQISLSI